MKAAGRVNYYMGHAQEAYYLEGVKQEGHWFGTAVEKLALKPTVDRKTFHNLLLGFSPDGKQALVQNAGDPNRASCWDLTFSAPKSVSVLWALAPAATRKQIEQAMQLAVEKALAHIEAVAGITRRGKGGVIKEHASLVFATFFEGVSRANDPAIHIHACLINLGLRQDGTTGALQTKEVFQHKMFGGALSGRSLAEGLQQRLGLIIEPEQVGFHIAGVPKNLCMVFSNRGRAIKKVMREQGLEGAVAAKIVALSTRPNKQHVPPDRLFAQWREVAQQFGWDSEKVRQLLQQGQERLANGQVLERLAEPVRSCSTQQQPTPGTASGNEVRHPAGQVDGEEVRKGSGRRAAEQQPGRGPNSGLESSQGPQEKPNENGESRAQADQVIPVSKSGWRAEGGNGSSEQSQTHSSQGEGGSSATGQSASEQDAGQGAKKRTRSSKRRNARPWWEAFHSTANNSTSGHGPQMSADERNYRFHTEWRRVFPKAPFWSLAQFVKVPVLAFPAPQPQWGQAKWEEDLVLAELRGQPRRLFPDAPRWSPIQGIELPALHLTTEPPLPRWWTMRWKKVLGDVELRIQNRHPFRFAPKWNPLRKLEIPALRVTTKKSLWSPMQHSAQENSAQNRAQEMGRSH